jgi:hypothetical protein
MNMFQLDVASEDGTLSLQKSGRIGLTSFDESKWSIKRKYQGSPIDEGWECWYTHINGPSLSGVRSCKVVRASHVYAMSTVTRIRNRLRVWDEETRSRLMDQSFPLAYAHSFWSTRWSMVNVSSLVNTSICRGYNIGVNCSWIHSLSAPNVNHIWFLHSLRLLLSIRRVTQRKIQTYLLKFIV